MRGAVERNVLSARVNPGILNNMFCSAFGNAPAIARPASGLGGLPDLARPVLNTLKLKPNPAEPEPKPDRIDKMDQD
jgi:hypothetical protein